MAATNAPSADNLSALWLEARDRAIAEGIVAGTKHRGRGVWCVPSGTQKGVFYMASMRRGDTWCTCLAGFHRRPVCKHRAAVVLRQRELEAAAAAPARSGRARATAIMARALAGDEPPTA